MKKRSVIISVLALVALLVVGGTMAWFTSSDDVTNTFKAGTVKIEVNENGFPENGFDNVNPGDTKAKKVTVKSLGSKATYVRVKLTPVWTPADGETLPVNVDPASYNPGDDWVLSDGWYYYKKIMNTGNETTPLITEVKFDGLSMDNDFQGATYTLEVKAEAVQASNGAYKDATTWGLSDLPAGVEVWGE